MIHKNIKGFTMWGGSQDLEIASLSSKMETMAFEFADMLKDGLKKVNGQVCLWDFYAMGKSMKIHFLR